MRKNYLPTFMREVVFRNWKFEVDSELTRKTYEKELKGSSDDCVCEYCENYRLQRENVFPQEAKVLFEDLGIDYRKEVEVSEYGDIEKGLPKYIGWFHFVGRIVDGEDCKKLFDENHWKINLVEINDNFKIGFTKDNSLSFFLRKELIWFKSNLKQTFLG